MIYESTLDDVDTAVVPYETASNGAVFAMVFQPCFAGTDLRIRALIWAEA